VGDPFVPEKAQIVFAAMPGAPADKSYSNESWGVMPSRTAAQAVPIEDRHLFYKTSSQEALLPRRLPALARAESASETLDIGKRRTKHFGVRLKVAKLTDRSSCAYTEFFHEHPMGDASTNKELAKVFRREPTKHQSVPSFAGKSSSQEAFGVKPTHKQLRLASARRRPPKEGKHEDTMGFGATVSSEFSSMSQCCHGKPPAEMAATGNQWIVKDNLGPMGKSPPEAYRTANQLDFKPSTAPADYYPQPSSETYRGMRLRTPKGRQRGIAYRPGEDDEHFPMRFPYAEHGT